MYKRAFGEPSSEQSGTSFTRNNKKLKLMAELIIANKELAFQNEEKEKRAAELIIANRELAFENEEKEKRAAELIIANKELAFQNEEKEKRAVEYAHLQEEIAHIERLNLIGNMAAGLAHEVRNPMTVIKGYLQYFKKKIPNSLHDQLDLVLSELARIEMIITDFLAISKINHIAPMEHDLNVIIDSIAPLLQSEALQRGISLELKLDKDISKLTLEEKEIKQLLLNIAMNGLNAMGQHGILTIKTKCHDNGVILSVTDSGCGISKELQKKIFDPFFTTRNEGTGLGLAVCASIVAAHDAKIKVQSKEGKGTHFIITFPV